MFTKRQEQEGCEFNLSSFGPLVLPFFFLSLFKIRRWSDIPRLYYRAAWLVNGRKLWFPVSPSSPSPLTTSASVTPLFLSHWVFPRHWNLISRSFLIYGPCLSSFYSLPSPPHIFCLLSGLFLILKINLGHALYPVLPRWFQASCSISSNNNSSLLWLCPVYCPSAKATCVRPEKG